MAGMGHNGGTAMNTSEDLDGGHDIRQLPGAEVYNRTSVKIASLEQQRKDLAAEIREATKEFTTAGGSKAALSIMRKLERMDPDERAGVLHEVDAYAAFKQYW